MASGYPASLDTFATTSPSNLGDDDAQARNHAERHDDIGDAMNKVQAELGTDPSAEWATVAANVSTKLRNLIPAVGEWDMPGCNAQSGFTPVLDQLYAWPYVVPYPMTLDRISVYVATAQTSSEVRLGLYSNGSDDRPGSLILDAGTVSAASTGQKDATISQSVAAGMLWMACVVQTAGGTTALWNVGPYMWNRVPTSSAMTTDYHSVYVSSVSGALPNPFGTISGVSDYAALLGVRRSA